MLCDAPSLMFCGVGKALGGIGREQGAISGQRAAHCMVQGGLVDPAFDASKTQLVLSGLVVAKRGPPATYSNRFRCESQPVNGEPSSLLLAPALSVRLLAMFSEGGDMRLQHLAIGFSLVRGLTGCSRSGFGTRGAAAPYSPAHELTCASWPFSVLDLWGSVGPNKPFRLRWTIRHGALSCGAHLFKGPNMSAE